MWGDFHDFGRGPFGAFLKALKAAKKGLKVRLFTQISRAFFRTWNFSNPSTEGRDMAIYKRERQKRSDFKTFGEGFLPPCILPTVLILLGQPLAWREVDSFRFDIHFAAWRFHPKLNPKILFIKDK